MADAADGPPGAGPSMLGAIRTQVMWNRLVSVVEEQAQALLLRRKLALHPPPM